jgi:hypothetical protein
MNPADLEDPGSFGYIVYGVFHDWLPHWPVQLIAMLLQLALIVFLRDRRNALVLIALFILPVAGLYASCKLFPVGHFVSSRYFITFLPLFFISLFLSLEGLEINCEGMKKHLRFTPVFLILFVASNLVILPLYYQSEKQDNRGLVNYLNANVRDGDRVFLQKIVFFPGVLHYAGIATDSRYYRLNFLGDREQPTDYSKTVAYQGKTFTFHSSKTCCAQYVAGGNRLWIVVHQEYAEELKKNSPAVFKGYFDGSFLNFNRFPTDVSFYLFLWDPSFPGEKGVDFPADG